MAGSKKSLLMRKIIQTGQKASFDRRESQVNNSLHAVDATLPDSRDILTM
jgi:hypothetical protein